MVLQRYFEPQFTDKAGFLRREEHPRLRRAAHRAVRRPLRPGRRHHCAQHVRRQPAEGHHRPRDRQAIQQLLVAVQPTRGLDVGAIEYIHKQLVAQRDAGKAVLLVSLELDEVMDVPDRILVMYEGRDRRRARSRRRPREEELGLYMAGAKRDEVKRMKKKNLLKNDGVQSLLASLVLHRARSVRGLHRAAAHPARRARARPS